MDIIQAAYTFRDIPEDVFRYHLLPFCGIRIDTDGPMSLPNHHFWYCDQFLWYADVDNKNIPGVSFCIGNDDYWVTVEVPDREIDIINTKKSGYHDIFIVIKDTYGLIDALNQLASEWKINHTLTTSQLFPLHKAICKAKEKLKIKLFVINSLITVSKKNQ